MPAAVPKAISAADQLRRSACSADTVRQACDLLLGLAAVECHASVGGPAQVPPALLRDLVIITARLAGRSWLQDRPGAAAAFAALQATRRPPPLPELDRILAQVLSERFSLPSPVAAALRPCYDPPRRGTAATAPHLRRPVPGRRELLTQPPETRAGADHARLGSSAAATKQMPPGRRDFRPCRRGRAGYKHHRESTKLRSRQESAMRGP